MDLFRQISHGKLQQEILIRQSLLFRDVLKDLPAYSSTKGRGYFIFIIDSAAFFLLELVHPHPENKNVMSRQDFCSLKNRKKFEIRVHYVACAGV